MFCGHCVDFKAVMKLFLTFTLRHYFRIVPWHDDPGYELRFASKSETQVLELKTQNQERPSLLIDGVPRA